MKFGLMIMAFMMVFLPLGLMAAKKKKQGKPEGAFQLIAQLDNNKMQPVGFKKTNLLFQLENEKFQAYVGCNNISGALKIKRNALQFINLVKTEKACPDYIDGLEEQFLKNLGQVTAYRWDGSLLLLMNNKTPLMKLKANNIKP